MTKPWETIAVRIQTKAMTLIERDYLRMKTHRPIDNVMPTVQGVVLQVQIYRTHTGLSDTIS